MRLFHWRKKKSFFFLIQYSRFSTKLSHKWVKKRTKKNLYEKSFFISSLWYDYDFDLLRMHLSKKLFQNNKIYWQLIVIAVVVVVYDKIKKKKEKKIRIIMNSEHLRPLLRHVSTIIFIEENFKSLLLLIRLIKQKKNLFNDQMTK